MKKAIIKGIAFLTTFVLALVVISLFVNKGNADMTAPMSPASLPVMAVLKNGTEINQMSGYTIQMDTAGMRESITTVDAARQVDAVVHLYGQELEGISYELRSIDGSRLIENTELSGERQEDELRVSFRLKDLMEEGEEYSLVFVLTLEDGRQARYYTRVIEADYQLEEKLDFVTSFSEATFDAERFLEEGFNKKLETSADGDNSTLARVDIHSTASQVTWGPLKVTRKEEPRIRVREIAPQTASVELSYPVSFEEDGKTRYIAVREYYRVRYTGETMYLLDYEREAEQYFTESAASLSESALTLGIVGEEMDFKESDGGTVFAFSQAGALYSYNGADARLARLFSFYDGDNSDMRTQNSGHGFRILQADETGNVTFLVYGYMSRGRHEGTCGVQVCYYSNALNVVEELVFIPFDRSADILGADLDRLSYVNGKNDLYLMLGGSVWHVNLENKQSSLVVSGISEEDYQISKDNSMLAWKSAEKNELVFMDLVSGEQTQISAGDGNDIRALGFMGKDLIYGVAAKEDIREDTVGNLVFPMHSIIICDFEGNVLKTYAQEGVFVTGCSIAENQINLERVRIEGNTVVAAEADQILYNDEIPESQNQITAVVTEELETVVRILLDSQADPKKVKLLTPKEVLFEGSRETELIPEDSPGRYYVYGPFGVEAALSSPAAAVRLAYERAGTAADENGEYIFKRDRLHTSNQIMAIEGRAADAQTSSLAVCLDTIFQYEGLVRDSAYLLERGEDVLEILEENLEGRTVLNLQGCSLDMVLYYPDREIPVLAVLQDGSAVLVIGFNEQNVVLMDPGTGTVYKKGMNDARSWFEENGNRFITYWGGEE
ncbi:MAG: hypothetical protein Q4C65_10630 [Eubacteriales bacterium]|nr:hypothetical protein [Eubacteriales bacterium]